MREAVIVSAVRTPVGSANKGTYKDIRPEDLAAAAVKGTMEHIERIFNSPDKGLSGISTGLLNFDRVLQGLRAEGSTDMDVGFSLAAKALASGKSRRKVEIGSWTIRVRVVPAWRTWLCTGENSQGRPVMPMTMSTAAQASTTPGKSRLPGSDGTVIRITLASKVWRAANMAAG